LRDNIKSNFADELQATLLRATINEFMKSEGQFEELRLKQRMKRIQNPGKQLNAPDANPPLIFM
jgi:hypothetical protein